MEKTVDRKKNIFAYTLDFFRSIGDFAKTFVAEEKDETKEDLEDFRQEELSSEDEKKLKILEESQTRINQLDKDHEKFINSIDYPTRRENFRSEVQAQEQEQDPIRRDGEKPVRGKEVEKENEL